MHLNKNPIQQENESMPIIICLFFILSISLVFLHLFNRPAEESRQTALERQIDLSLSMNYERVRDLIRRLDSSNHGTISANEMRSIIEDLIDYTLKPDEYYQLLKSIPMNEHGRIKYKEYLKQVLDRTLSRQEQQFHKTSRSFHSPLLFSFQFQLF